MKGAARTVLSVVAIAFLAVVGFRIVDTFVDLPGQGCETEICCPDCERLPVTRIIDGDTFVSRASRVRLFGVDTPEAGERCAAEATSLLTELAGDSVRVERGPRSRDVYDRQLFYVYTDSGDSIDEMLVREGLARAWTTDGQHLEYLVMLEAEARSKGVGCLW